MARVGAPWPARGSSPERGKRGKEEGNSGGATRGRHGAPRRHQVEGLQRCSLLVGALRVLYVKKRSRKEKKRRRKEKRKRKERKRKEKKKIWKKFQT
jgi:hypothetical protein